MRRREFLTLIGGAAVSPTLALAQQPRAMPRIGWVILGSPASKRADIFSYYDSFRAGLRDLGYRDGNDIEIIARNAEGNPARLPALIDELTRENVSVIVSPGPAIRVVREKVKSIPVVFAFSGDPVAAGLVDTLARGRGNLTGLTYMAVELNGKRIDLLKGAAAVSFPRRAADQSHPSGRTAGSWRITKVAAALGLNLDYLQVRTPAEFDAAFQAMREARTEAIVAVPDNLIMLERDRLARFALEQGFQ